MRFVIPILILSISLSTVQLIAQYDSGTVIYNQTGSRYDITSIQKNYIVEDFDGDFIVDIIMVKSDATNDTNQLLWYKGDGTGNFSEQATLLNFEYYFFEGVDHRAKEIFYTDMNGDGNADIIFQNTDTGFVILLNDGQGNIINQVNNEVTNLDGADLKEIADIDGDGNKDVLLRGRYYNQPEQKYVEYCLLSYNDGNGNFSSFSYLNTEETSSVFLIETGDIDGDNDLDIIYCGNRDYIITGGYANTYYIDPYITVYENLGPNGLIFKESLEIPQVNNAEPAFSNIILQDINNDGTEELLIEYGIWDVCEDEIHMLLCSFSYLFQILDYHLQNETFVISEEYNSWLHGYALGNYRFTTEEFYDNAFQIQFAHQNADNNLDVLSINVPQGKLHWYYGNGNGGFNNGQVVNFNSQYSSSRPTLRVVDIDNDTDLDIFVLLNDDASSTLTVFKNFTLSSVCPPILDLTNNTITNGVYQADNTTISSGNVEPGNTVLLKAGTNVRLQSGFRVPVNTRLKVAIDSCN